MTTVLSHGTIDGDCYVIQSSAQLSPLGHRLLILDE